MDALSGIDFVVLKGGLLTRRIFGDLSRRVSSDNDLLIRSRDAETALARLRAHGFCPRPFVQDLRALARSGRIELWPRGDVSEVTLDLHTRAFDPRLFAEDEEFVWSSIETVELHGRTVRAFDAPLSLAHLAAHTLSHFADPEHLEVLRLAWARLGATTDSARLHRAVARTLGLVAFEFVILLAFLGAARPDLPWPPSSRARFAARALNGLNWERRSVAVSRILCVLGSCPEKVPRVLAEAIYPGIDELHARYGGGPMPELVLRHLIHLGR